MKCLECGKSAEYVYEGNSLCKKHLEEAKHITKMTEEQNKKYFQERVNNMFIGI